MKFISLVIGLSVLPVLAGAAMAQTNCAGQVQKPRYPPLARSALIHGDVTAQFEIGGDGKPLNLMLEGHPLLRQEVSAIKKTTFDAACSGNASLIYKFVLDAEISHEVRTSAVFNPPNEYVIVTNRPGPIIDYGDRRPSWFRRLFRRVSLSLSQCLFPPELLAACRSMDSDKPEGRTYPFKARSIEC